MALKLDPRWPLTWRSPTSVQFGVDPARVILDDLTDSEERMLAALAVGVSLPGLTLLAHGRTAERDHLLERLAPALLPPAAPATHPTVVITGTGPVLEQLTDLLAANGVRVVIATGIEELENLEPDLAVMVGHYVLSPSLHSVWLRRDIPHLPVVVADGSVTVGPLIEPGSGPCLLCLELHHRDADAAWPAVASQLLGRRAFAEPALVASEAASLAARAVLGRLRGIRSAADSVRIDAASGERTTTGWLPHPECGCRGIAHLVAVAPASSRQQETGSPAAARPAPVPG